MAGKLSLFEKWDCARLQLGAKSDIILAAQSKDSVSPEVLLEKIQQALQCEPRLACFMDEKRVEFVEAQVVKQDILDVDSQSEVSAEAAFKDELLAGPRLDTGKLLWRVKLFTRTNVAVLRIAHVAADGKGAGNLFAHLLSADNSSQFSSDNLGPPPDIESVRSIKPSLWNLMYKIFWYLLIPNLPERLRFWITGTSWPVGDNFTRNEPLEPLIETAVFDGESFAKIGEAARKQKVSVHSFIRTSAILALRFSGIVKGGADVLVSATPLSLRWPGIAKRFTGNYVSTVRTHDRLDLMKPFWDQARQYNAVVSDPATREDSHFTLGSMQFVCKPTEEDPTGFLGWTRNRRQAAPEEAMQVSDIGPFPMGNRVSQIFWSSTFNVWQGVINSTVIKWDNGISITSSSASCTVMDAAKLQNLNKTLSRIVSVATQNDHFDGDLETLRRLAIGD